MALVIARPADDEYAEFYRSYVTAVDDDVVAALERQLEHLQRLEMLPPEQAGHRYADGKWSVREIIGHVTDAERIFSYRLLRIARGDTTPLAAFDENEYAARSNADRRPFSDVVSELRAVRRSTLALVHSLEENALTNHGTMSGTRTSARAIVFIIAGHFAHHMRVLRDRYGVAV